MVENTTEKTTENQIIVSKQKLLEAGTYFGHNASMWNPKMKPFIHMKRGRTHIIDLVKTQMALTFSYSLIKKFTERKATFIFVGTRPIAQATIKYNALRTNSFYVSERWLGGTLTNHLTIQRQVRTLEDLEKKEATNFAGYTKKEGVVFAKKLQKLRRNLSGIREMKFKPHVMIIADPNHDIIAVKEARKMGIKIIGLVDTNTDPSLVDVPIPANDDSLKSLTLLITILADAISEVKGGIVDFAYKKDDEIILPTDGNANRSERQPGNRQYNNLSPRFSRFNRYGSSETEIKEVETPTDKVKEINN